MSQLLSLDLRDEIAQHHLRQSQSHHCCELALSSVARSPEYHSMLDARGRHHHPHRLLSALADAFYDPAQSHFGLVPTGHKHAEDFTMVHGQTDGRNAQVVWHRTCFFDRYSPSLKSVNAFMELHAGTMAGHLHRDVGQSSYSDIDLSSPVTLSQTTVEAKA